MVNQAPPNVLWLEANKMDPPNLTGETLDGAHHWPWRHGGAARRGARPSDSVQREWEGAKASRCSGDHNARKDG